MNRPQEKELLSVALALGAREVAGWSTSEERLANGLPVPPTSRVKDFRSRISEGEDPLGEEFCAIRTPAQRRTSGATYTPYGVIEIMLDRSRKEVAPARVVDPGSGSARFLVGAGRRYSEATLLGIELDPVAAILSRAHLAAAGLACRSRVIRQDYREVHLEEISGSTLFIGNPPYVRHHLINRRWKDWLAEEARSLGFKASRLAGLHVHFFLATALQARQRDFGIFITSAEWLDVNYGGLLRQLLLNGLGACEIIVLEPRTAVFPDAATTTAITNFEVGESPACIQFRKVNDLSDLDRVKGESIGRRRLASENRWSVAGQRRRSQPRGYCPLGELCRVHRGQATGANRFWIAGDHSRDLPGDVLYPTITRARELFEAGSELTIESDLKKVIDIPPDLSSLDSQDLPAVGRFLERAKELGVQHGYIARNRSPWWSVRLREPAPILVTYMARRPPAFVINVIGARNLNIAHGLYPRIRMSDRVLRNLVKFLNRNAGVSGGRTYAHGLTKFEPGEMERIVVPGAELLESENFEC